MSTTDTAITARVKERVGFTSAMTDTAITYLVDDAVNEVNGFTGQAHDESSIPDSVAPVVTHLAIAGVLAQNYGSGTKYNLRVGEFALSRPADGMPHMPQVQYHLDEAKRILNRLGTDIHYSKVND